MKIIRLMAALIWALVVAGAAQAKPLEARSDNFILYGNIGEGSARQLLTELEDYRAAILQRMGASALGPEIIPVRIYIANGSKEIEKLTGAAGAGGVYRTSLEGPVFFLNSRSGFRRGNRARATALHEYTHHLLASFSNVTYPRWFNEGLAEYLSTFQTNKDGNIILGRPDQDHAYALKNIQWLSTDLLLSSIRNYPYPNDSSRNTQLMQSIFYAQSWLAVHYIQSTPGYPQKLSNYIELLNQPDTPVDVFEKAFGITPAAFGEELKAYYKRNRYLSITVELPKSRPPAVIRFRDIERSELSYHMAEAIRHFAPTDDGFDTAAEYYEDAEDNPSLAAKIQISKALFLSALGKPEEAITVAESVLASNVDDPDANRAAGMLWLDGTKNVDTSSREVVEKARHALIHAMQLNPDDITAHYYYAKSFVESQDKPTKQAVASAQTGLDYYRSVNFVDGNMPLAHVLMVSGERDEAIPVFQKAVAWSRSSSVRAYARYHLKRLQSGE